MIVACASPDKVYDATQFLGQLAKTAQQSGLQFDGGAFREQLETTLRVCWTGRPI